MIPKGLFTIPNIISIIVVLTLLIILFSVKKIKLTTNIIVRIGVAIALSAILGKIKLYKLPQGGSITPGSMIPIFIISFIYGPQIGMLSGFLLGIINLVFGGYIVQPIQLLLDYPLAYMSLGLSGYLKIDYHNDSNKTIRLKIITGTLTGVLGRLLCHFLSGIVFFASYAKGNPYIYSLVYNGSFLGVEFFITSIILMFLPFKNILMQMDRQA